MVSGKHHKCPEVKKQIREWNRKVIWGQVMEQRSDSELISDEQQACLPRHQSAVIFSTLSIRRCWVVLRFHSNHAVLLSYVSCFVLNECCSGPRVTTLILLPCSDAPSSNVQHVCRQSSPSSPLWDHAVPHFPPHVSPSRVPSFNYCFLFPFFLDSWQFKIAPDLYELASCISLFG